jgi:very-short-patch-repair endonuclease
MNEIEQMFYDAFIDEYVNPENKLCCSQEIEAQVVIGLYKVDFIINGKYVIEIDGHDYHKTKEQREYDYTRDRYLIKRGYVVIRFTGTEVFLQPDKCAVEALLMVDDLSLTGDYEEIMSCKQFHEFMKKKEQGG